MAGSTYVTYLKKEVNTAPTAYFTASPASGPVPLTVQFDASISSDPEGSISGYAWNFGDNTQGQGVMVTHVYQTAGTYTVTLTVTDKGSMKGTTTRQITGGVQEVITNTPPIANFAADKYSGTVPLTVAFDASSSYDSDGTIASYSWDFGDGTTGSGVMSSHVYTSPNIYRVSMSVTDNKGASSSTWKSIDAKSGTSGENSQNILTKGKISISSQPSGAQVYVDNIVKGKTPCLIEDVSAGKHTISVEMQGYTPWSMEVDVNSGSTLTLSANLNALVTTAPPTPTKGPLNILSVLGALYAVSIIFVLRWRKP
jgi:PKD repeat protein